MQVIPIAERSGRTMTYIGEIPAFFPKDTATPTEGIPVEVMITGVHFFLNKDGSPNYAKPKQFFVRVVTDYYTLVEHEGFRSTDTGWTIAPGRLSEKKLTLTPGRVGIRTEHCVPGRAYIRTAGLRVSRQRVEGVPDLASLLLHLMHDAFV